MLTQLSSHIPQPPIHFQRQQQYLYLYRLAENQALQFRLLLLICAFESHYDEQLILTSGEYNAHSSK